MKALAWLAAAAFTLPCAAQDGRRITAPPDVRTQLDLQHYYLPRELQVALTALETAYPEFLRLESLGRSANGVDLWVMTVARKEGLEPAKRPAALLVGGMGVEDIASPELALYTLLEIVQNHARDDAVARLLDHATIYVVPCANPDVRERAFAALEAGANVAPAFDEPELLDRNFPVRWDPMRVSSCGAYPLSKVEARALAEFMLGRPNIAIVQRFSGAALRTSGEFGWPLADVRTHRRIAAEGLLESVETISVREGALLSFAYEQLGAFAFALPGSSRGASDSALPPVGEILPLARAAASANLRLFSSLPRLEVGPLPASALDPYTWQVDVDVRNAGRLPTCSELGAQRFACASPQLEVAGAPLLGAAFVRLGEEHAAPAPTQGSSVVLPQIAGGETLRVRLFLGAAAEGKAAVVAKAVRAGEARAELVLP